MRVQSHRLPVRAVVVAAALGVVAAVCSPTATPAVAAPQSAGSDDLAARADHTASFVRHSATGSVRFFGTARGHAARRPSDIGTHDRPERAAAEWLARYGQVFGVADAAHQLAAQPAQRVGSQHVVHLRQMVSGLPVVGGELVVTLDADNDLVSVSGEASPGAAADTSPAVSAEQAAGVAQRFVSRASGGLALSAGPAELSVLDQRLLGGPVTVPATTVWAMTVSSADSAVRHQVFVDAARGRVLLDVDSNSSARNRVVCNAGNIPTQDPTCTGGSANKVGDETAPPSSTGDADAWNAFRFSGAVYDFYKDLLGRDSIDDQGMTLASTVHFCPTASTCPSYPNAFWDGVGMAYGDGYSSALDVVGHELTHGVTEHMSKLFSYYQSGAINESISDVMGELIQQLEGPALNASGSTDVYDPAQAWTVGEKLPDLQLRSMADPTAEGDPDRMTSSSYSAHRPWDAAFDSGGVHANDGVNNKAAYLMAVGGTFNGQTMTGLSGADQAEKDVKLANIYYQVEGLLTPGSDFADLYVLLPQACRTVSARGNVLPLLGGGTTAVSAADCTEVGKAVAATEMNKQPVSALAAIASQAPVCTNGGIASKLALDAFDSPDVNPIGHGWTKGASTATDGYGLRPYGQWWWSGQTVPDYGIPPFAFSSSGHGSLWGDDADPSFDSSQYDREDAWVRATSPISAHSGTFVRFNHVWDFDYGLTGSGSPVYYFDGGRVEYSTDAGSHWLDAGALFVNGGYNGTITNTNGFFGDPTYVDPNPLKGQKGFVGSSHGWTSSRLDLSSLNGKSVQLRWRIGTDEQVGGLGWYVDDVYTYSCNPTALTLTSPSSLVSGTGGTVTAHLARTGTATVVTGKAVQLWQKKHGTTTWSAVGAARTTNSYGNASWAVAPSSTFDYRARFAGSTPFAPSGYAYRTVPVKVRITKTSTPATFALGHSFAFTGSVAPNHAGKAVFLQRYYSGKWNTLAKRVLSASSTYSASYQPTVRGTLSFRMLFTGDLDHAANSVPFTVKVT